MDRYSCYKESKSDPLDETGKEKEEKDKKKRFE